MDRSGVLRIMSVLRGAYPQFYRQISKQEAEDTVNLWLDMFENEDYRIVSAAVKSIIEGDEKGFPPTIGQIKAKLRLLTGGNEMTDSDAWNLVANALRNGLYGANEEFGKLPHTVQRIVGSPAQLRSWAMMDSETIQSVVASNFRKSYRAISEKEREIGKLPEDVKKLLTAKAGVALKELTE